MLTRLAPTTPLAIPVTGQRSPLTSAQVYDGCKSSVEEYRDIGRDVGNTHLVLSANERYWKAEESRGRSLIVAQEEDLKQLAGNSYEIFGKIQAVLDKHRSLGDRERVRDKLKWSLTSFMKDIGPQRQSLQDNTHALAIFNATLTAENASSIADQQTKILQEHSQLLKFLVTRYIEFQNGPGNSVAPAFSRVGVKDIEEDEDDSWRNINTEFESAGISSTTVKENRGFIREWIATVIADDGEKETAVTAGSTIVEDDEDTVVAAVGDLEVSNTLKDVQPGEKEPELEEPTKPLKQAAPPPLPPPAARQASASSHRSQSSTWREPDINNPNHSSQMIAKVLKSKYGDCNDLYQLPIKRAFHHLDWTDRGWISIGEVQKYCYQAAEIAGFSLNESALGQLAKEMDVDDDNQVSLGELTEIVVTLRRLILEFIIIVNANNNGRIEAGAQLKVLFDTSLDLSMLPFGWNYWQMPNSCRLYRHDFLHSILGQKQSIAPLQTNFTNAAFIATGHCASQVSSALKKWRASLLSMPKEEAGEYTQALNNVLEATAKFHTLNSTHSQTKLHPFDYCSERINILPPGQLEDLADYPEAELTELCRNCWRVLDPILGFVYDLKPDGLKQVFLRMPSKVLVDLSTTPPSLSEWRRLRMLERSKRIVQDLGCWKEMKKVIQKCQEWTNVHNDCLDVKAKSVIETTENLSRVQREAVQNASLHSLEIREVRLTKLKRDHFGKYRRAHRTYISLTSCFRPKSKHYLHRHSRWQNDWYIPEPKVNNTNMVSW